MRHAKESSTPCITVEASKPPAVHNQRKPWGIVVLAISVVLVPIVAGSAYWLLRVSNPMAATAAAQSEALNEMEVAVDKAIAAARTKDSKQLTGALDSAITRVQGVQGGASANKDQIATLEKLITQLEQLVKSDSDLTQRCKLIALRSSLLVAKQPIEITPLEDDVIWVNSVPPGADVWCTYRDEMENDLKWGSMVSFEPGKRPEDSSKETETLSPFKAGNYRGQTPLAMKVSPGQYVVGVAIPISPEYGNQGMREFPYLPTEARESFISSDGELTSYARIFTVEKNEQAAATVSTVFCPRGTSFDDAIAGFPEGDNFPFEKATIRKSLADLGQNQEKVKPLSPDEIETILASLARSGTALLTVESDENFVVAGLRDRDSLAVRLCTLPNVALTPPSMPNFTPPVIPNFTPPVIPYTPPPVIPNINIPNITPNIPTFGGAGTTSSRKRPGKSKPATSGKPANDSRPDKKTEPPPQPSVGKRSTKGNASRAANGKLQVARNLLKIGKFDAAKERLEALIRDYPGTAEANEAKQELEKLK